MNLNDESRLDTVGQLKMSGTTDLSTKGHQPTFIERFVDSFFRESNIRWMLVIGSAIVFASSLMLVTREWSSWPATFKFLTIVAYTTALYGFSEVAWRRLGLLATGNTLQALILLLLPIPFLSLPWLGSDAWLGMAENGLQAVVLLLPTAILTWFLSQRIFERFLRGRQQTFQTCYWLLCIAGALPALQRMSYLSDSAVDWLAGAETLLLWAVMTVGVIKVNRHVFWLAEEHRLPRIFGFFPIALLGGQFLILLATKTAPAIEFEWLGFGCVMVAGTVLAASRSTARVFKERTGDLVRPLPWPIVLPILVGLALVALGVTVSFWGFSYTGHTTYAAVPTASVAACLLLLAASETRHRGLVWCGLILTVVAYQCTPVLMGDLVAWFKANAAAAVQENRLPFAFYGLTYLPLLSVFAIASRGLADRRRLEFSQPLQQFVTILSAGLLALALTHIKAVLPVSLISCMGFLAMAQLFQDRRYVLGSVVALLIATTTFVPAANAMHWLRFPLVHIVPALSVLAALTSLASSLDRWFLSIPLPAGRPTLGLLDRHGQPRKILETFSIGLTIFLTTTWLLISAMGVAIWNTPWLLPRVSWILITFVLALQTVRTKRYGCGLGLWVMVAFAVFAAWHRPDGSGLINISTVSCLSALVALASWCGLRVQRLEDASLLLRWPLPALGQSQPGPVHGKATAAALLGPLCDVCMITTWSLGACFHLPQWIEANYSLSPLATPLSSTIVMGASLLLLVFTAQRVVLVATVLALPLWFSACMISLTSGLLTTPTLLPLLWTIPLGAVLAASKQRATRAYSLSPPAIRNSEMAAIICVGTCKTALLTILLGCLLYLSLATLAASIVAASFLLYANRSRLSMSPAGLAIVLNILTFYVAEILLGNRGWLFQLPIHQAMHTLPYLTPLLAISAAIFDHPWKFFNVQQPQAAAVPATIRGWSDLLRVLFVGSIWYCWSFLHLPADQMGCMIAAMVIMTTTEIRQAVRHQSPARLWQSLVIALALLAFLSTKQILVLGSGAAQFALMLLAVSALGCSHLFKNHPSLSFSTNMLAQLGLFLPGGIVILGIQQSIMSAGLSPLNTLAMLSAAGIYFYHGTATGRREFTIAAVAIFNVTLMLAWRTLHWHDLQLYLVPVGVSIIGLAELMRKELPHRGQDTLRYAGALTILISPMLEILGGSWWHLLTLLLLCVGVILAAIGLRLRALMMTGVAFLFVDLVSMVLRSSYDHPQFLWLAGLGVGLAVIGLAAVCENQREQLLARIRSLSAELATWR